MILLVTYDLHNPGRDYDKVAKVLESADSWIHPQGSVWILDTQDNCETWRDSLKNAGDKSDEYFVVQLTKHWAGFKMGKASYDWLKDPDRTW